MIVYVCSCTTESYKEKQLQEAAVTMNKATKETNSCLSVLIKI